MGQYWKLVNLDKREYVNPHEIGCGLKLWEQLANHPSTGTALVILCAAMPEARGGGDLDLKENWHGPERKFPEHNIKPAPMPEHYEEIAAKTIGRWAGDRIAFVGDYAEPGDLAPEHRADLIFGLCQEERDFAEMLADADDEARAKDQGLTPYKNISAYVARVIEHELGGKFVNDKGFVQYLAKS